MTLLFEDLPQIILALIVKLQTKDLVAPVHLVKAGYGILEPIIQIMIHIYQYCTLRKNYYYENETQMRCGLKQRDSFIYDYIPIMTGIQSLVHYKSSVTSFLS